jgi:hypothetical protein
MACLLRSAGSAQLRTNAQDTLSTTTPSFRLTALFLSTFDFLPSEEGSKRGYNFLLGVGFIPDTWWLLAPHFYITYTHYENERISMTSGWTKINIVSLYPSVKLARFILVGFGYSVGTKNARGQDLTGPPYVVREGAYSTWSPFLGIDFDLRIHRNAFLTFGMYYKEPAPFYALGGSFRL